jgi:protein-S-isoprenylcysteine O-methyltransferase Ste14
MRLIPPAWALGIGIGQRALATAVGRHDYPGRRLLTATLGVAGAGVMATAVWQFWHARTTIDPRAPHAASSLVTTGLYSRSRNPIYIADALVLAAHAAWLGQPLALFGVPVLAAVLRPQVRAEEAALKHRFGSEYDAYVVQVPRWIGPRG